MNNTVKKISWSKKKGYECSSKGDVRFDSVNALLEDGRNISQHYYCDVKGYDVGGTNWKLGKGKPPLDTKTKLFPEYLNLWKRWANIPGNMEKMVELYKLAEDNEYYLSDQFATTPINQAHALSVILNEMNAVVKEKVSVELYTDGSANPNPGPAGYGFCGTDSIGNKYIGRGPITTQGTNNIAELLAVAFGILQIRKNVPTLNKLKILSDSKYVLDNLKYVKGWKDNNFFKSDGQPVANKDIWIFLTKTIDDAKLAGISISFEWVRGHNGTEGNEIADVEANEGRLLSIANSSTLLLELTDEHKVTIIPAVKLTKINKVIEPLNRLFAVKRWFYYTNVPKKIDGKIFYFGSTYDDDKKYNNRNLGKRAPDTMYSMLLLKEPIKVLDDLRDKFNHRFVDDTVPIIMSIVEIGAKKTWDHLVETNSEFIKFNGDIATTLDGKPLGNLHFPPKLSCKLGVITTDAYNYIRDYLDVSPRLFIYDITESFYVKDAKGKLSMNQSFTVSDKFIDIPLIIPYYVDGGIVTPIEEDIIRLTANIDIPIRNTFSALLKQTSQAIKVSLLVMNSCERSCRVAVIIECQEDIACFFSPDSNFRIKR